MQPTQLDAVTALKAGMHRLVDRGAEAPAAAGMC